MNSSPIKATLICHPKCSTCRKARNWLIEKGISFAERRIVEATPSKEELEGWWKSSGLPLKRFFNTSGLIYQQLNLKEKLPALSPSEQLALLASNGMLIKRPLLIHGNTVQAGFNEAAWQSTLAQGSTH